MSGTFAYARKGRSPRTAIVVAVVLLALLLCRVLLDAAWWIVGVLALFTLPAIWDLITDPPSGLALTDERLTWHSGKREATVALSEIALVRLDTRLDLSVRVTLLLESGQKIRLPFEVTPPHEVFERELNQRGLKTRRTHFQLFQ